MEDRPFVANAFFRELARKRKFEIYMYDDLKYTVYGLKHSDLLNFKNLSRATRSLHTLFYQFNVTYEDVKTTFL